MFTVEQYDQAIEALQLARKQVIDGTHTDGCDVCGGDCDPHQCGHNPLYAMYMCQQLSKQSEALHSTLHFLAGYDTYMGEQVGPSAVVVPPEKEATTLTEDLKT